jgi:hypothetical protein
LLRVASARILLPIIDKDTAPPISAMEASMMPEAFWFQRLIRHSNE